MPSSSTTTTTSTTIPSGSATPSALITAHVISQATVEALGDWLLESASVQSVPAAQEQRRWQSYKSSSLINKSLKQSQEERRKVALAEQAKKRYQFTNHARKLALFANGQPSEESSDSEDDDNDGDEDDEEEEEEGDEADKDQEEDDDDDQNPHGKRKKKKRSNKKPSSPSSPSGTGVDLGGNDSGGVGGAAMVSLHKAPPPNHKRRLSSGSESEATMAGAGTGKKKDKTVDALSPKKPRLQKNSPKTVKKHKDRNPFRDQMMMPEPMTDIPTDLDTSYYIVPLPIGHRCFVISADGKTTARLPSGQLLVAAFESCLPAGSSQYRGNRRSDYCILDCVYSSVTRTFWTIDIMCWRGHPVYECETEFRFWWLRGKLAEVESLQGTWIASQTKEWEQEQAKRRQKKAKQLKRRQEKAAAAVAAASMDVPTENYSNGALQEECDDGDDEAGTGGMEVEPTHAGAGPSSAPRKFWPIVFTPLPYFNASIDLIRLLAESMYQPTMPATITTSPLLSHLPVGNGSVVATEAGSMHCALALLESVSLSPASTSSTPSGQLASSTAAVPKRSTPVTTFAIKTHPTTSIPAHHSANTTTNGLKSNGTTHATTPSSVSSSPITSTLGTMALSGEIATAASLFPAHDTKQKIRQDQTLLHERAAGLVFFNKKTMYVLGSTPLCGWVAMDQIGDVFFGDEGGIGPVPGTSAVEGREIEMEDALERIRI
ncbi:hypothetical protein BGZ96_001326 [Linnemannia gamsii]|uniref:Snurportin-1 n=1 Tax=Linnemannia gamsii TaxID=64522 RepID=A0ABQ7JMJ1_9FUNG|nr:hypothetical protein BGZ96_001326 [Linnemannia gamsii]